MYACKYDMSEGMNEICTRLNRTNVDKIMMNFHDTTSFNIRPHLAQEKYLQLATQAMFTEYEYGHRSSML